jgi:16S rRNA (cytosine967-C5)-methyltransferase
VTKDNSPGFPARRLAAEAFRRVLAERRSIEEALQLSRIPRLDAQMSASDHALARAIVTVAFRRLGTIRAALRARLSDGRLPDAGVLEGAIVTGAAQVLFMEAADHAAVDLAVEAMKSDPRALHYAGLGNAVLRRIASEKAAILAGAEPLADAPEWLLRRWRAHYGAAAAEAIARAHGAPPHVDLTFLREPVEGTEAIPGTLLPNGSLRLSGDDAVSSLPGYEDGVFQVQDVAASLPARLIEAKPGMKIYDLCAAPGGKTAQLAARGAEVIAVERSAERAKRLTENMARLGLTTELVIADAGAFVGPPADAVLLDAPCSATGTIRRHPEVAWTKTLRDVLALAGQQQRLLDQAATLVKPGGVLVFSTCSLECEEGERQIEAFLARTPAFRLAPVGLEIAGIPAECFTPDGYLRVLPSHFAAYGGADGFFSARLQRAV